MKKILALILALAMLLTMAACGGDTGKTPSDGSGTLSGDDNNEGSSGGNDESNDKNFATEKTIADVDSYATAYEFYMSLIEAMTDKVSVVVETHNKKIEESDPEEYFFNPEYYMLMYMPFISLDMAFTATLTDESDLNAISMVFSFFGSTDIKYDKIASGNYKISYKDDENNEYIMTAEYNKDNKGIRFTESKNGEITALCEYISLGNDRYALQNRTNRAVVTYKDGNVLSVCHSYTIYNQDYETKALSEDSAWYDETADSIIKGGNIDEAWVKKLESEGSLERIYEYKDGKMTISGQKSKYDWETDSTVYEPMTSIVITE